MLLNIKKRQEYLKFLGFYKGEIDGIAGQLTKKAYKDLQNKYFVRKSDKDGIYGINTDILLKNAYNIKKYTRNFKLNEFKCKCNGKYCTSYPKVINIDILKYIQDIRNKYGIVKITSGIRCEKWNKYQGGIIKSKHIYGKAIDFKNTKICKNNKTIINFINEYINYNKSNYSYTNGYGRTKKKIFYPDAKSMKNTVHIDIK